LLFPVPLGTPSLVRRVSAASRTERIVSLGEPDDDGEPAEDIVTEVKDRSVVQRKGALVPKHSQSTYFKKGRELQYKEGKGPKKDRGVVFVVEEHTIFGISFKGIKGKVFVAEYFEPVS
jgi:hypothetical protein